MELSGKNIIGYENKVGTKDDLQSINPATNERLNPIYKGVSDADFEQALNLSWQAFLQYRQLSNEKRAVFLETIADEIESIGDTLIERAMQESGLPQARLQGERGRTCGQLRLFSQVLRKGDYQDIRIDKALPDRQPLPRSDIRYRKLALGPVAVFGASNFPLAFSVAGGDTASALAAGCTVIVKAHNAHVGTSELVGLAIQRAVKNCGMPEGVFSLLYGAGNDIGQKLAEHPYIQAIGFTGSRSGGLALLKTAQQRPVPIPVYAEMSSINPVYIQSDALKMRGAEIGAALAASMAMGAGQFCTSPGLVFVVEGEGYNEFARAASTAIKAQTAQTMLTPQIAKAFVDGVDKIKKQSGISLLSQGQSSDKPNHCQAHLFEIEGEVFKENELLKQEVFGSSALIVKCKNASEVLTLTQQLEGQLTVSIHATKHENEKELQELISHLELTCGRILFNGFGTGVEVCDAMVHGGPYPATSDGRMTSVGTAAIDRFVRPVSYQDFPIEYLPDSLK